MKQREVSIVIFYNDNKEILLQKRGTHSKLGEEWGFFGGGIEEGETKEDALKREILEELEYEITDFHFLGKFIYDPIKEYIITVNAFVSKLNKIDALNIKEGSDMKFFKIDATKELKMLPGDHTIIATLNNYLGVKK